MNARKSFLLLISVLLAAAMTGLWLGVVSGQIASAAPLACSPSSHHSGVITASETWCAVDSPHYLDNSVIVSASAILTIEPGVTVMGDSDAELNVFGHLLAVGSAAQPINFTSLADSAPNQWAGLSFDGAAGGGTGQLTYVTVRYGGQDNNSVGRGDIAVANVQAGEVRIENSQLLSVSVDISLEIHQCLWVLNSRVTASDTRFSGCAAGGGQYDLNYPVYVSGPGSVVTFTNNTFINNYKNRIALEPGAMMAQDAVLWPQAVVEGYELTLLNTASFSVPQGITLTVMPGVTVMGNGGRELRVLGRLEAPGTPTQPVTFTSVTNSAAEQWSGLVFEGGSGLLENTTVRYAGAANSAGYRSAILAQNVQGGELRLDNSRIVDNDTNFYLHTNYGLILLDSRATVLDSFFARNGVTGGGYYQRNYPLYIAGPASAATLAGNTFTDNGRDKIGLAPGAMASQTSLAFTRQAALDSYEFDGSFTVTPTQTLTLEPGVTVSGRSALDELRVQGDLQAVGTPALPITFTSGADSAWGQWPGVVFAGGTGHLSYVTARYGGIQSSLNTNGTLNAVNVPAGGLLIENSLITQGFYYGLQTTNSPVTVYDTQFTQNGADPRNSAALYASGAASELTLSRNRFWGNARGLILTDAATALLTNNAFLGGWTGAYGGSNHGVTVGGGAQADLLHTTFANLHGSGLYVVASGTAGLTNSIFAENGVGITVESGGSVTATNTLWDRNGINIIGVVNETGGLSGPAGFAPDGYHLTRYSMALEQGVEAGITEDIDEESRPLPAATAPDLGADEFPYTFGEDFAAEKFAYAPQWVILPDPLHGNPSGYLRQGYFIRYFYGSPQENPPALSVTVTDTLPAELVFSSQQSIPGMSFVQQLQSLFWQSLQPLQKNQSGEIVLSGLYDQPIPGQVLTNHAQLSAGEFTFELEASSEVPLFQPLITYPGNGEICTAPGGALTLTVTGAAQNSAIVELYEASIYLGQTTATASGMFSFTYSSTQVGVITTTLSARACNPFNPAECSQAHEITLTPQRSFWNPQRSFWEFSVAGTGVRTLSYFRNSQGWFSTQDVLAPKAPGRTDFTFHQYICFPVDQAWITVDGVDYLPEVAANDAPAASPVQPAGNWVGEAMYHGYNAYVRECSWLNATLDLDHWQDSDCWQTDPDGYVFDVTQGLDPISPTLHALQGITVTCMVSIPQWGGWVPWPAELWDNQINPQVTGESGYFAFFTPPGHYYLQVDAPQDFQDWRSPVVEVITEVVHVNVPLTPAGLPDIYRVTLNHNGPDTPVITISVGSTVEWIAEMSGLLPPETLAQWIENPVLRLLSALDPLSNRLGFDSGMFPPGQRYRRQFTQPGVFEYDDGLGHSGRIVVIGKVYLPVVRR